MVICPVTKKNNFIVPATKNTPLFATILHPFGTECQNFNTRFEFSLHMPVKFYLDALRFARDIYEKPFLSKYYYAARTIRH